MSNGPIQIQLYPNEQLLNTKNDHFSLSSQKGHSNDILNSSTVLSMKNSSILKDSMKRKRQLSLDINDIIQKNLVISTSKKETTEKFKRPKTFSFLENQYMNDTIATSINKDSSHINIINSKSEDLHHSTSNSIDKEIKNIHCLDEPIQDFATFKEIEAGERINREPFLNNPHNLITERTDLILEQIKNTQNFEDARKIIRHHINYILSMLETQVINSMNSNQSQKDTNCIPIAKANEIIQERDQNLLEIQHLESKLKNELALSHQKDNHINQLKSELTEKNYMINQINHSIDSYIKSQSDYVQKNCGFNERLPPDVY